MSLWQAVGVEEAAFSLLLSDAVRRSPKAYLNPLGVGAFSIEEQRERQFGLYLDALRLDRRFVDEPRWIRLNEISAVREQLVEDFPEEPIFLDNGGAFVGPPPILHAGTSDIVVTSASIGTLGAEVTWGSSYGLLTAGHVGGAPGTPACAATPGGGAQQIGTVVFSQTAAGAGAQGAADVAVIELSGRMPGRWGGRKSRGVQPLGQIEVIVNAGPVPAIVKGMFAWLSFPGTNLVFANTYMTDTAVTKQGDSGAPAIEAKTGDVVGHVVGGTTGVASYIQEIDYQLRAISRHGVTKQSQFSNIAL